MPAPGPVVGGLEAVPELGVAEVVVAVPVPELGVVVVVVVPELGLVVDVVVVVPALSGPSDTA